MNHCNLQIREQVRTSTRSLFPKVSSIVADRPEFWKTRMSIVRSTQRVWDSRLEFEVCIFICKMTPVTPTLKNNSFISYKDFKYPLML